jgi:hypothetical protein
VRGIQNNNSSSDQREEVIYNTFFYKAIKGFERMEIGRHFFLNHLNNQKKKKSAFTDGSVA